MGLDMYLYARRTIYAKQRDPDSKEPLLINNTLHQRLLAMFSWLNILRSSEGIDGPIDIRIQIGYWRKANMIHGWICKQHPEAKNCEDIYLSKDELETLKEMCHRLLANCNKEEAKEVLPCTEGFFFGTYEYDEDYWEYLKETVEILERALTIPNCEYIYRAWW